MLRTLAFAALAALAFPAAANVMTFTDLTPRGGSDARPTYTEDGITMSGRGIGVFEIGSGVQHMDGMIPAPNLVDFTMDELFTPISIDVHPYPSGYCPPEDVGCFGLTPYTNLWVSGLVDDAMVSELGFSTDWQGWQTIDISSLGLVEQLRVEIRLPESFGLPGTCWGSCGHFDLDNVTVSVPEPGTLLLLSSAFAGIALTRRRRQRG